MSTWDEWLIIVNAARRRQSRGILSVEDTALTDMGDAIDYLLSRVSVDESGRLHATPGRPNETILNAIAAKLEQ